MIDSKTFNLFKDLIYEKSGITLKEGKESLLESRIGKRMRELKIETPKEYFDYLKSNRDEDELISFIDVISTNVTHFFREAQHFIILEQLIKLWVERGQKKLRIWCAASSTGQEPYSIALTAAHVLRNQRVDLKILATDICTRVLKEATNGVYKKKELETIPQQYHLGYLKTSKSDDTFEMSSQIKELITFARLNLSEFPYVMSGPFDFVFCRNVMIYFDNSLRSKITSEVHRLLKPSGVYFVGHSETLTTISGLFETRMPSVYQKVSR